MYESTLSPEERKSRFGVALRQLINSHCMENTSNTPDFVLANYMRDCLEAFDKAVAAREKFYGRSGDPTPIALGSSQVPDPE
jgi:hypothetical protein